MARAKPETAGGAQCQHGLSPEGSTAAWRRGWLQGWQTTLREATTEKDDDGHNDNEQDAEDDDSNDGDDTARVMIMIIVRSSLMDGWRQIIMNILIQQME